MADKADILNEAWNAFDKVLQDEGISDAYFGALIMGIAEALAEESLSPDACDLLHEKLTEFYEAIGGKLND